MKRFLVCCLTGLLVVSVTACGINMSTAVTEGRPESVRESGIGESRKEAMTEADEPARAESEAAAPAEVESEMESHAILSSDIESTVTDEKEDKRKRTEFFEDISVLTPAPTPTPEPSKYENEEEIKLDMNWQYSNETVINSGSAKMYVAEENRKGIIVAVNAGHGTSGGTSQKTYCHPDHTPKVTGGTTGEGSLQAVAVSTGMTFADGVPEREITLKEARMLRDKLIDAGYDVLMIRDGEDVQLDNVARTVIANNIADCHIAIHWDSDGLTEDKGCFFLSVPDELKTMEPVASTWEKSDAFGAALIEGLRENGERIHNNGSVQMDLTQISYSTIPSIDIELGNQSSDHSDEKLEKLAEGMLLGIDAYFGF